MTIDNIAELGIKLFEFVPDITTIESMIVLILFLVVCLLGMIKTR